jgi:hypothetical protein
MNKRWTRTPEQRYFDKVDRRGEDECWPWNAGIKGDGYGSIYWNGRSGHIAHRVGWLLWNGPIPEGLDVCHKCDNPLCHNPKHWFLGTRAENNADKTNKGRQAKGDALRTVRQTKLDWHKVRAIRLSYESSEATQYELAARYGVSQTQIWHVIHHEAWRE